MAAIDFGAWAVGGSRGIPLFFGWLVWCPQFGKPPVAPKDVDFIWFHIHQKNMIYSIYSVVRRERFRAGGWKCRGEAVKPAVKVGGLFLLKGPGFETISLLELWSFCNLLHMIRSRSSNMNAKKYPALAEENLVISIWFHMCFLTSAQLLSTHGFPQVFSCFFMFFLPKPQTCSTRMWMFAAPI